VHSERPDVCARSARRLSGPTALAAAVVAFAVGYWQKLPCQSAGWPYSPGLLFGRRCYSDIPFLLFDRGMEDGTFPYAPDKWHDPLEYPVLSGLVMDAAARLSRLLSPRDAGWPRSGSLSELSQTYFAVATVVLLGCALVTVWATVRTSGTPRDGWLVALAPSLALTGTVNWDLLPVAAVALALLAWTRNRPWLAGVCIGLGTAAKLYPVLLLGPVVVLALRGYVRRRNGRAEADGTAPRTALAVVAGAVAAWLAVNVPVAVAYPDGWAYFYRFNQQRGAEIGSIWYVLELLGHAVTSPGWLNLLAAGSFVAACAGVAILALLAPRAPRAPSLARLGFLVVAAFLLTNKVYNPQYALWLLPLAVLAGLRLPDLIAWQAAETLYWFAVWADLGDHLGTGWWVAAMLIRLTATGWLCVRVVVDVTGAPARVWWPRPLLV
jgi:uncharacterized membrane protein